jgi:hypothetical protein
MENGQVNIYLKRNPDADFLFIVRLAQRVHVKW